MGAITLDLTSLGHEFGERHVEEALVPWPQQADVSLDHLGTGCRRRVRPILLLINRCARSFADGRLTALLKKFGGQKAYGFLHVFINTTLYAILFYYRGFVYATYPLS